MTTYAIPRFRFEALGASIAKLNRRAERLGVEALRFEATGAEWCDWKFDYEHRTLDGQPRRVTWEVVEVELDGGSIKLPGWTFVGTIEHLDGENILRAVPGETIPEAYRTGRQTCDHCGLDRQRNDTFVVRSDDGEFRQVGRSCTADFLGSVDPQRLASFMEAVSLATSSDGPEDEGDERGPRYRETYRPEDVVAVAIGAIRAFGFVKSADPGSTRQTVADWQLGHGKVYQALVDAGMEVTGDDWAAAEQMVEWAKEQTGNGDSYLGNLGVYARQERVNDRAMGLLASLPTAYGRAMGRIAERKVIEDKRAAERETAEAAPSGRVTIEGVVVGRKTVESDYGPQFKMTLLMPTGWRLYCTEPSAITPALGDTVRLTVTVEPSTDDLTFAFGKRPSKAAITAEATAELANCPAAG